MNSYYLVPNLYTESNSTASFGQKPEFVYKYFNVTIGLYLDVNIIESLSMCYTNFITSYFRLRITK